ncbi:MAG: hypothetical protein Q4E41_06195 [Bacteroidales bacterium]|nr:hypothetical protein [Bacteroidales bacterium]
MYEIKKSIWLDWRSVTSCERSGNDLQKHAFCARFPSTPTVALSPDCSLTTSKKNRWREQKNALTSEQNGQRKQV